MKHVPNSFMLSDSVLQKVSETITDLESSLHTQTDIDVPYDGWCSLVTNEMYGSLPYKSVLSEEASREAVVEQCVIRPLE